MKFWTKFLAVVVTLAMVLAVMSACKKDPVDNGDNNGDAAASDSQGNAGESKPTGGNTDAGNTDDGDDDDDDDGDDEPSDDEPSDDEPSDDEPSDDEPQGPTAPDPQPNAVAIETALAGFITGDALDGKLVANNGFAGTKYWTGTTLEGYALMTTNPGEDDTKAAISLSVAVSEFSILKFKAKVDSDIGDVFSVNLDEKPYAGVGERDAGEYEIAIPLSEGEHEIVLIYSKDDSGFDGTDTVYVSAATLEDPSAIIDGEKDAFYDGITPLMINNPIKGQPDTFAGGGRAYIKNDTAGLYIYVEVTDKYVVEDSDGDFDNEDKVQVYLDYARSAEDEGLEGIAYRDTAPAGSMNMKMGWVNANPAGDNNPTGTFGSNYGFRDISGITAASVLTDNGYAVEIFVPLAWGVIQNNTIGLGIQIGDDTGDDDTSPNGTFYSAPDAQGSSTWWSYYELLPDFELTVEE